MIGKTKGEVVVIGEGLDEVGYSSPYFGDYNNIIMISHQKS
jgi:hypothetical protein